MTQQYSVPAISRMGRVLDILSTTADGLSLTQLVDALSIPKSTLFRILFTLVEQGVVREDRERRRFTLGAKLVHWGTAALKRIDIKDISHSHLTELALATHECYYLAVLEQDEVMLVDRVERSDGGKPAPRLGHRSPIHCIASGQVIAAYQDEATWCRLLAASALQKYTARTVTLVPKLKEKFEAIRMHGYAIADGEFQPDLWSAAAPIFDHAGRATASIMLAMPSDRAVKDNDRMHDLILRLQNEATAISICIGYKGDL